ncbi:MAG: hypothetical protein NC396_00195 [Bacteroides sp.]|nr:hypothetical protein [Bacteroides sp.]MCM1084738.1 hypothetical protein [Bacteroides sp.]
MKKIVLVALLLTVSFYGYSQNSVRLDSLNREYDKVDILIDSLLHVYYADTTMTKAEDSAMRNVIDRVFEERKKIGNMVEEEKRLIKERRPADEKIWDAFRDMKDDMDCPENYKLYPTKNMYIFLKLDTRTGCIYLVQYSVEGSRYRFETTLSSDIRVGYGEERKPGRFELYPTQNMYNFIMLDKVKGRTWQVQWDTEEKGRMVLQIGY